MSFEKKTWRDYPNTTTPISAEELNRIEEGVSEAMDSTSPKAVIDSVFTIPENLFDPRTAQVNQHLDSNTGSLVPDGARTTSNWVAVHPGDRLTISPYSDFLAYYTKDKTFVRGTSIYTPGTRTVPEEVYWVRVAVRNGDLNTFQINRGDQVLPYTPGREPYLDESQIRLPSTIKPIRIEKSTNIIDVSEISEHTLLNIGDGGASYNTEFSTTGYFALEPNEEYTGYGIFRISYYDANYSYLSQQSPYGSEFSNTPPPGATFARVSFRPRHRDELQLSPGATLPPWEPYWVSVEGVRIPEPMDPPKLVGTDPYVLDSDGLSTPFISEGLEDQNTFISTQTSDVYSLYDDLVDRYPDYVERIDLGPSSTSSYRMYAYILKPQEPPTQTGDDKIPTAVMVSGTHGYEKTSVYQIWYLAKELCENWESHPVLETLRWNVEVVIVPVASPHAYDNAIRTNANGVDVSRNYTHGWRPEGSLGEEVYSGTGPLTEPENIAIDGLMQEYKGRAMVGGDFHNFSTNTERPHEFIWIPTTSDVFYRLGRRLLSRMSRLWKKNYSWVTNTSEYYGWVDRANPGGSTGAQFQYYGIPGGTFEVSRRQLLDGGVGDSRSDRAMTLGYEAIVNFLAMSIDHGVRYKNSLGG